MGHCTSRPGRALAPHRDPVPRPQGDPRRRDRPRPPLARPRRRRSGRRHRRGEHEPHGRHVRPRIDHPPVPRAPRSRSHRREPATPRAVRPLGRWNPAGSSAKPSLMSHPKKNLLAGSLGAALLAVAAVSAAGGAHVDGNHFTLDGAPTADCAVGATCIVTIKLAARASSTSTRTTRTSSPRSTAARASTSSAPTPPARTSSPRPPATWTKQRREERHHDGRVQVAPEGHEVTIGGTFKLSVCSPANCQLEQQACRGATVAAK